MRALYLLRHSLTEANARHLYGGSTDSPLTEAGRETALAMRAGRPLPEAELYVSSGMRRADETLALLTGHRPDLIMPELREMDFGAFEMRDHEALMALPEYRLWIEDATGGVPCPGGECRNGFQRRVLAGGEALLARTEETAVIVCHGGVIVYLMQAWFPDEPRHFYQWQPEACRGYRVTVAQGRPVAFEAF